MKSKYAWLLLAVLLVGGAVRADEDKSTIGGLLKGWRSLFSSDGEVDKDSPPAGLESDAAYVVRPEDLLSEGELLRAGPWRPPDFSGQSGVLGWSENAFSIPRGFETRVAFWLDIYTKYTSDQGVLHDRDRYDVIYETIDFGPIMDDENLNIYQKSKKREKLVDQKRKDVIARLQRLEGKATSEGLSGDDLKTWKMLERYEGATQFKDLKVSKKDSRVRFQLGQRDRFIIGIYHSGRYLREMERIFRENKIPVELTRLPFVESSFNLQARSRVGASGIWQFMPRTARPYLKMNRDLDERNDPLRATVASARLLKQNYMMLQSWPLAITGYNHGPYGVRRIADKLGTRDIAEIVGSYSSRSFGFASENFYACFLAALEAERHAVKYFGEVKWGPEVDAAELKLKRPFAYRTLVDFFDGETAAADLANPHLLSRVRKSRSLIPAGAMIRVPTSRRKLAEDFLSGRVTAARLALALKEAPVQSPPAVQPAPANAVAESQANPPSAGPAIVPVQVESTPVP